MRCRVGLLLLGWRRGKRRRGNDMGRKRTGRNRSSGGRKLVGFLIVFFQEIRVQRIKFVQVHFVGRRVMMVPVIQGQQLHVPQEAGMWSRRFLSLENWRGVVPGRGTDAVVGRREQMGKKLVLLLGRWGYKLGFVQKVIRRGKRIFLVV